METNKNYVVLGQTIPEKSRKYGLRVCTAGYDIVNKEFVRVYPLAVDRHFKRWENYFHLPVRKNPNDSRPESWRLQEGAINKLSDLPKAKISRKGAKVDLLQSIYYQHKYRSINELNEDRKSLAVIKLKNIQPYFVAQDKKPVNTKQLDLFLDDGNVDTDFFTREGFKFQPRVKFKDEAGKPHDLGLFSWDAYMHQSKLAPLYGQDNLWQVLNAPGNSEKFALIGNQNNRRSSWLIITLFSEYTNHKQQKKSIVLF